MSAKKTVLYVVEDAKSTQFRYRIKNVMEALENSNEWQVEWVLKSNLSTVDFSSINLVVVLRQTGKDGVVPNFVEKAHKNGLKVLFDLDDLIFDYKDLLILMKGTNSKNVAYWTGYVWGIRRIAKKVDGFITTNEFLAEKLKRSFEKPTGVVRNSLNKDQIEKSEKIVEKKSPRAGVGSKFLIGYFSGSPTHAKDFAMIEPDLLKFLRSHDNVRLSVVGYMRFSKQMQEMIDTGRVEVMPPVEYLNLQELISKVDINIAPLVLNDFTNCKSELKFFESAIVDTATIASPSYTFKKVISDGENGFLAEPNEWYSKLEYVYNNPKEVQKVAENAKKTALDKYYGDKFIEEIKKVYEFFG